MDNGWGLRALYNKVANQRITGNSLDVDADRDRFAAEGYYKWDGGGASLTLMYERNSLDGPHWGPTVSPGGPLHAAYVNPAVMHSWGDFSVHAEMKAGWGRQRGLNGNPSHKADGLGLYLDGDYNYGPGHVNLGGWWVNGTRYDADKHSNLVGMGDFVPFIVAYHSPTLGTNRYSASVFDLAASVGNQQYFTVVGPGARQDPQKLKQVRSPLPLT